MNTTINYRSQNTLTSMSNRAGAFIRKRSSILAGILSLIGIGMTGCANPTEPAESAKPVVEIVRPGVGSRFIYKSTVTRGSNGIPEVNYDTMVVTNTGLHIGGRAEVVEMVYKHTPSRASLGFGLEFMYFSYDANGDVSRAVSHSPYLEDGDTAAWSTYPVGSRTSKVLSILDDDPPGDDLTIKSDYTGSESIAVGSEKLASHKISTLYTFTNSEGGSTTEEMLTSFAPSIGTFTRQEMKGYRHEVCELVAYSLKP